MTNVFTADEVVNLGKHQTGGQFHPFTCANRGDGNHRAAYGDLGALIATVRGWICPFCDYTQDWAYGFMKAEAGPAPLTLAQSLEDRPLFSTPPAAANSPITPTVNKNGSGTNSETPEKTCPNDPNSGPENQNIGWRDGVPSKPWADEWFIAETTYGYRVVLTALPEEWSYDFKTADDTYIKADKIKRWMQFPDSHYIAPASSPPAGAEVIERLVKALEAAETYVIDGVTTAKQNLEINAAYPARKPRYEAELQEARDIYAECQAARRAALAAAKDKP